MLDVQQIDDKVVRGTHPHLQPFNDSDAPGLALVGQVRTTMMAIYEEPLLSYVAPAYSFQITFLMPK